MSLQEIFEILGPALKETMIMVVVSTFFASIIGMFLAIILILTDQEGSSPKKENSRLINGVYKVINLLIKVTNRGLDFLINVFRSFPFVILMVVVVPLTRAIAGKSYGTAAAIIPLTIAAAPFVARIIESSLKEVDKGVIEAAKSLGATKTQIIFKIMLKEALPSIASGLVLTIISIIGYSAMAGAIGGGGLGNAAINYGYTRYNAELMWITVVVIIIVVQIIQSLGNYIYKKLS